MTEHTDLFVQKALAGQPIDQCLVIDAHGHLGENAHFPVLRTTPASLVAAMDRIGIASTWVSSIESLFGAYAARGNAAVEEGMRQFPGRICGYMVLDIGYPSKIIPEMERCLKAGFQGVKIYPPICDIDAPPFSSKNYGPLLEFANAHRLPVLAHTWGSELDELEPWVKSYPNINFLMAHTGSMQLEKYIRLGLEYPNVYLELCFSPSPRGLVERLVKAELADKVIWGSDTVFMSAAQQIGRVLFARISPEDKEKILGLNAKRALRIG